MLFKSFSLMQLNFDKSKVMGTGEKVEVDVEFESFAGKKKVNGEKINAFFFPVNLISIRESEYFYYEI